jgi:hypothetical protein
MKIGFQRHVSGEQTLKRKTLTWKKTVGDCETNAKLLLAYHTAARANAKQARRFGRDLPWRESLRVPAFPKRRGRVFEERWRDIR